MRSRTSLAAAVFCSFLIALSIVWAALQDRERATACRQEFSKERAP